MSRHIENLIYTFGDYYERKRNYAQATTLLIALCSACNVTPNFPRYNRFKNINEWYESVTEWLYAEEIITL